MAIIRDNPDDWTAQLTEEHQLMYFVLHFKMEWEKALKEVEDHEGQLFYVRLPLHVNTYQQLFLHLVLKDVDNTELNPEQIMKEVTLSDEEMQVIEYIIDKHNGETNGNDIHSTIH